MTTASGSIRPESRKGPLLVLAGALCFSSTGTVQAFAPPEATQLAVGFLRMVGGAAFMLAWCWFRGLLGTLLPLSGWPAVPMLFSVLGMCLFQTLFFACLPLTGVTVGTVVCLGTTPVAVGILGWVLLREKPSRIWYVATVLAITGVVVLAFAKGDDTVPVSLLGLALSAGGGVSYAVFVIMSKRLVAQRGAEISLCVIFTACSILLLPTLAFTSAGFDLSWVLTPRGAAVWGVIAFLSTALPYSLSLTGLRTTPVALASTLALGEPLGASLLGILLLGEPVSATMLTGLVLLFVSMGILVKS